MVFKLDETYGVKKVYGKVTLCKTPIKPFICEKKKKKRKKRKKKRKKEEKKDEKPKEEKEEEKKKKKDSPLDLLTPSKLELETFKRTFQNNKDKEDDINKFWKIYVSEGYSLWWLEYQNLPTECKVLFRTSNSKGMFL